MRCLAAALAATALVAGVRSALATPSARLVYSRARGAESCPDEDALRRAVAARVGYDPFFAWAKKTIVANMAPAESRGFVANVNLVDEQGMDHGARALRTEGECRDLLDAAALAIAIAIDPRSLAPKPVAPETAAAPPPTPPVIAALPAANARPAAELPISRGAPPGSLIFEGSAGAVVLVGFAPFPAAGFALGAGLRWRRLSLALEALVDTPVSSLPAPRGGHIVSWLGAAALVPCGDAGPFFACAVGQVGSIQAKDDAVDGLSKSVLWLAAGARLGVRIPLNADVALRARGEVVADLWAPTLTVYGDKVWPAPTVAGSAGADIVVRF